MDQSAIVDRASQACADVFRGTPVFLAYAYGSRIEGGMTPASDLDIGYYLATPGALPVAEEMILADRLSRRGPGLFDPVLQVGCWSEAADSIALMKRPASRLSES